MFYHVTTPEKKMGINSSNALQPFPKKKDGVAKSRIDETIKGVFFGVNLYRGDLPTISPHGSERVRLPIARVVNQMEDPVLFYASNHSLKNNRYIILVLADRGSVEYYELKERQLPELKGDDNPFLKLNGVMIALL